MDAAIYFFVSFIFQKAGVEKKPRGEEFGGRFLGDEPAGGDAQRVPAELVAWAMGRGWSVVAPLSPAHHFCNLFAFANRNEPSHWRCHPSVLAALCQCKSKMFIEIC